MQEQFQASFTNTWEILQTGSRNSTDLTDSIDCFFSCCEAHGSLRSFFNAPAGNHAIPYSWICMRQL
jgi:hypothetical protein